MKYLRTGLLITTILVPQAIFAAESADEVLGASSPKRPLRVEIVEPTPGEKVAQRQKEVLVRERFVEIFGEDTIEKFSHNKGIDWALLRDTQVPFDSAAKRTALHHIKVFLSCHESSHGSNEQFDSLYNNVLRLSQRIVAVHEDRLENRAKTYFGRLLPNSKEIDVDTKGDGVQLGKVIIVTFPDQTQQKFYVKTHSKGLKASQSSGAKPLDPVELLVYKILENFRVGSEAHFFGRDESNFYVATKDANSE